MMDPAHFFATPHPNSAETPSPRRPAVPSAGTGRILPFRMIQRSVMMASTPVHSLGVTYVADRFRARRGHGLTRSRIRT